MRILLAITALCLLSGCYPTQPRPSDPNLLDPSIPVKPHNGPVEVFFPGEETPKKPYRQVALLEIHGNTPAGRVNNLKAQARRYGADAILITSSSSRPTLVNDESTTEALIEVFSGDEIPDHWENVNVPFMQGLAIVYEDSFTPEKFNQYAEVFSFNAETESYTESLKTVEYNFQGSKIGEELNADETLYALQLLYPTRTDVNYLVNDRQGWEETRRYHDGSFFMVNRQQNDARGNWIRRIKVSRDDKNFIRKVELLERNLYQNQGIRNLEIYISHFEGTEPAGLTIYEKYRGKKELAYKEEWYYAEGRLSRRDISKVINGSLQPWIRVEYKAFPEGYNQSTSTKE